MKFNKDTFEIIFFARAGQGAKTAAEIIVQAAVREGKYVQAFPFFGPERSGAPTRAYVRVSSEPIRTHEPVIDPDAVVVLDETLLGSEKVAENLDRHESLIINTKRNREEIAQMVKNFQGRIYPIDATGLALAVIGQPNTNSVVLGKIVQITEVVKLESITHEFRKIFEKKIGKEMTEKNVRAIQEGYDAI
ncbi:MAG: 2-oxoacid:acceptor oxidoreductase family protein [Candidatus Moranbacteria bacterium]|nr:2-oxoacid:acceptor oxidoreductase family protein [Candidatus Moranbacteria bacterium]